MASSRQRRAEPRSPDGDDRPRTSLLGALLSGVVRSPAGGGELGHARQGVTALQLVDGVLEVASGIDAEDEAVVGGHPRRTHRTSNSGDYGKLSIIAVMLSARLCGDAVPDARAVAWSHGAGDSRRA